MMPTPHPYINHGGARIRPAVEVTLSVTVLLLLFLILNSNLYLSFFDSPLPIDSSGTNHVPPDRHLTAAEEQIKIFLSSYLVAYRHRDRSPCR